MPENKAVEWLEEQFNHKWRRAGLKETVEWYGSEITYFSVWHQNVDEDEFGNYRYRNPGTIMKLKDDSEGYGMYYEEVEGEWDT